MIADPSGIAGLWLVPSILIDQVPRLPSTKGVSIETTTVPFAHGQPLWAVDPLVHLQRVGDEYPAFFSQGRTLRNGPSTHAMKYVAQRVEHGAMETTVITELAAADGLQCTHHLAFQADQPFARVWTTARNASAAPVSLELLTSFSLGGISPFTNDSAPDRLVVHRIRSSWALEGRLDSQSAEALQLEPSVSRYAAACERFGQVGTMPVRGWFPFAAVEDTSAGVCWGARLAWAGSWQMEVYRKDDTLSLSGGLADREFGQWVKTLAPGESFETPAATLTCVSGTVDDVCARLTAADHAAADAQPAIEHDLPIIFNEWCTTWGSPTHDKIVAIAERLRGSAVKYLVIDAGWYDGHGTWGVNLERFPHGMKATADAVRAAGLVPGLWFEFENCSKGTPSFDRTDWHLHRDGHPITLYGRRFWDLRKPEVVAYLADRVIGLLRDAEIGYLKVDYNETIGIGCDGAESLGEGLRAQVAASQAFFRRMREELPDIVIENCASGGHRLEPSMLALTAMSSFSDAHEPPEIPIIAANLHRALLPRQSQIWAVIRKSDDEQRLIYSLAATFLGRMCLSGDVLEMSAAQWNIYRRAETIYRAAWPVIKHGTSRRYGPNVTSYRAPLGWQAVVREGKGGAHALAVIHAFGSDSAHQFEVPLPPGQWRGVDQLAASSTAVRIDGQNISCTLTPFTGAVVLLSRADHPAVGTAR